MNTKGTLSNPYSLEEYEAMLDAGTWKGGYVKGLGYCLPEVQIVASSNSMDISDSEHSDLDTSCWPDSSDPFSDPGNNNNSSDGDGNNTGTSGNSNTGNGSNSSGGSGGSAGGGNGSTGSGGGNGGSSNSNQQVQNAASCSEFADKFTNEMIMKLQQYNVDLYIFENSMIVNGKEVPNSHYNPNANMIAMEASAMTSFTSRVHEVVHFFQKNVLNNSMQHEDLVNIEYQAYAVSKLFARAIGYEQGRDDEWDWLDYYIKKGENGEFTVTSQIYSALDAYARTWFETSDAALKYNNDKYNDEFPTWKDNYSYNWSELLNELGIRVQ